MPQPHFSVIKHAEEKLTLMFGEQEVKPLLKFGESIGVLSLLGLLAPNLNTDLNEIMEDIVRKYPEVQQIPMPKCNKL